MHIESEFFCVNTEEEWKKGLYKNIEIQKAYEDKSKCGISILEKYKYSLQKSIESFNEKHLKKLGEYAAEENGFIYYIEDDILLEYDHMIDEITKSVKFPFLHKKPEINEFEILNNKMYILFKEEETYRAAICTLGKGLVLQEIEIGKENIQASYINKKGHVFILTKDMNIICVHIKNNKITRIPISDCFSRTEDKNSFIIAVSKENIIVLGDKNNGTLTYIYFENMCDPKVLHKSNMENLISIAFDNEDGLIINSKDSEKTNLYYSKNYNDLELIRYFKMPVNTIKTDSLSRIYIKDLNNVIYILGKKLKVNLEETLKSFSGIYYSKVFDSYQSNMKWNKIMIDADIPKDTQIKIKSYAFDRKEIFIEDKVYNIEDFLRSSNISFEKKEGYFNNLWSREITNPQEALFQETEGRYMILRITLNGNESASPIINKIRVYYNRNSYLRYLPEIYQSNLEEDDFLERYLLFFESFYMELEEKIDSISNYFDIDKAPKTFLKWLCEWMGLEDYKDWEEAKLRKLLKRAAFLNQKKGTKLAIEEILKIYLGTKPIIVENFQIDEVKNESPELKEVLENLHGNNPFGYTVLINAQRELTVQEINSINKILKNESPAYCEYNIVLLRNWMFLDKQSYLGVNSKVSGYNELKLDGNAVLPFNTVLIDDDMDN